MDMTGLSPKGKLFASLLRFRQGTPLRLGGMTLTVRFQRHCSRGRFQ